MTPYFETLTNPQIFDSIPLTGNRLRDSFERQGQALLEDAQMSNEKLTIAIRTLNEARDLERLLETVEQQRALGDTQVLVVDNESTDGTPDVARAFGAEVVSLAREDFTYSRSMNLCLEAADHPNVFMTVGHAALVSSVAVEAAKRIMEDKEVGGAFAVVMPNSNASPTELAVSMGCVFLNSRKVITKASVGVMGATNAVFNKQAWEDLGRFDERYQNGGEDTQMAKRMLEAGLTIAREPLVSVHHTHGLGPINYARQVAAWARMAKGDTSAFDPSELAKRRPDLDFS